MEYMRTKPVSIYILPEGLGDIQKLSEEKVDAFLTEYEDTGWEPKLGLLYEACGCTCIDMRALPGLGTLWFDDEGRLTGRLPSPSASALYEHVYRSGEGILGTAVLVVSPGSEETAEAILGDLQDQVETSRRRRLQNAN